MKAALSRAGNAFSNIMGHPWWVAYDVRVRTGSADGSRVRIQSYSGWDRAEHRAEPATACSWRHGA
jgi:hypothetical protein